MKIIIRAETDDTEKLERIQELTKEEVWVLPQGSYLQIFVIDDAGKVERLICTE